MTDHRQDSRHGTYGHPPRLPRLRDNPCRRRNSKLHSGIPSIAGLRTWSLVTRRTTSRAGPWTPSKLSRYETETPARRKSEQRYYCCLHCVRGGPPLFRLLHGNKTTIENVISTIEILQPHRFSMWPPPQQGQSAQHKICTYGLTTRTPLSSQVAQVFSFCALPRWPLRVLTTPP